MRNPPSRRQYVLLVVGFLTVAAVYAGLIVVGERTETGTARPSAPAGPTSALYVSPAGSDTNDGSERSPLKTVQAALNKGPRPAPPSTWPPAPTARTRSASVTPAPPATRSS